MFSLLKSHSSSQIHYLGVNTSEDRVLDYSISFDFPYDQVHLLEKYLFGTSSEILVLDPFESTASPTHIFAIMKK